MQYMSVSAREEQPRTLQQLVMELEEEWSRIPLCEIWFSIWSIPHHCAFYCYLWRPQVLPRLNKKCFLAFSELICLSFLSSKEAKAHYLAY